MNHRHSRAGKVHLKDAANRWTLNPNSIRLRSAQQRNSP